MPRAATSVTTMYCARPARNFAMLILRAAWAHVGAAGRNEYHFVHMHGVGDWL